MQRRFKGFGIWLVMLIGAYLIYTFVLGFNGSPKKIVYSDLVSGIKNEQIQEILRQVENEYMVTVVGLLDSAKTIFKDIYQTMLIVLEDIQQIAIAVDEVVAVTNLEEVVVEKESLMYGSMVQRFLKGKNDDDIIYHLNQEALFKRLMNNMR